MKTSIGFYVQINAIKFLVKLLKHVNKNSKKEIFKQVEEEFLINKGYYIRRVYFEFIKELINVFSIKFLENYEVVDKFNLFLNDKSSELRLKAIGLLNKIVPFASEEKVKCLLARLNTIEEGKSDKTVDKVS